MSLLPPMPDWNGMHVLVIHFPIALLMVAPVPILLGLIFRKVGLGFALSGLVIMSLGLAGAYLAVETGEAAADIAPSSPEIADAIEEHEELAESARTIFTILTVIYLVLVAAPPLFRKKLGRGIDAALQLAFLAFYAAGLLVLANTAHHGGALVHNLGVHAKLPAIEQEREAGHD